MPHPPDPPQLNFCLLEVQTSPGDGGLLFTTNPKDLIQHSALSVPREPYLQQVQSSCYDTVRQCTILSPKNYRIAASSAPNSGLTHQWSGPLRPPAQTAHPFTVTYASSRLPLPLPMLHWGTPCSLVVLSCQRDGL